MPLLGCSDEAFSPGQWALVGWLECHPIHPKVVGSIPCHMLRLWAQSPVGYVQEATNRSLSIARERAEDLELTVGEFVLV